LKLENLNPGVVHVVNTVYYDSASYTAIILSLSLMLNKTLVLYKSFTYLLTYLPTQIHFTKQQLSTQHNIFLDIYHPFLELTYQSPSLCMQYLLS